jgi:hypothetical protein
MEKVQHCPTVKVSDTTMFGFVQMAAPKKILFFILLLIGVNSYCQLTDAVFKSTIQSVRFHMYGDQMGLPVYALNSGDQLELHFDDMDANTKSYYYTYQLCDYNWQPVNLSAFDFIKGFTQQRISTYRYSSIAFTRYTHYQAILPDRNSAPSRSGNYIVKVFLDGDTSKLAFTRRLLVLDKKTVISANVIQPFAAQQFRTHQKIQMSIDIKGLNTFSAAQQVKVVILQNNRWDNCRKDIMPTFTRGTSLEFTNENDLVFAGGKEWRWLDLRSFSLYSDRVDSGVYNKNRSEFYLKTDGDRSGQKYVYFADLDGMYAATTYERINPYWQGDYAKVHFSFATSNAQPFTNKDIYIAGQLTDYKLNDKTKMIFNAEKGVYETTLMLKQGYYNYTYLTTDKNGQQPQEPFEGNYFETENSYTILVYYRSFTDRADQLIGVSKINSRTDRPGLSF